MTAYGPSGLPRSDPGVLAEYAGLPRLWGRRGFWQVRLRWAVAPVMIAGILVGRLLGFEFDAGPIVAIALASPAYNVLFALVFGRYRERLVAEPRLDRLLTYGEIVVDYAAMFLLIYFTGGVSSPLIVFLIFHVIIAAIQFSAATAHTLAGVAAGGLWLMLVGQVGGWLRCDPISFRGVPLYEMEQPVYAGVLLVFFTGTLFVTAGMVSRIMSRLRDRVGALSDVTRDLARANERLQSLYRMLSAIGAERRMEPVLDMVAAELAKVTEVPAVGIKLLSEDGRELRYVAAHGMPEELIQEVVHLDQSPINRRVIEGEMLVESPVDSSTMQLQRELSDLGIGSALLTPLKVEERAIGTLGFYDRSPGRFAKADRSFIELAAELVAIAIEHARSHEAVEELMQERSRFMLEVAHNLRAPLGAGLSVVDLLSSGHLGELTESQLRHLERLDARLRTLDQTIGELLAIARTRDPSREVEWAAVDLELLARRTEETFRSEAAQQGLELLVRADADLPAVESAPELLGQVLENLVSNAVKYTPSGGRVELRVERQGDGVRLTVDDNGIGVPAAEQHRLFGGFFRASNARRTRVDGTGLGLALVRRSVERLGGTIELTSEEGRGTAVVVDLPTARARREPVP